MSAPKKTTAEVVAAVEADAKRQMKEAAETGARVRGIGLVVHPTGPDEGGFLAPFDLQVAKLREAIVAGKVRYVCLNALVEDENGDTIGKTELFADNHSMTPELTLWALEHDLAGRAAEQVYGSIARMIDEFIASHTKHLRAHLERSGKATEN